MERRVSIEFFAHPPRAAYSCTSAEEPRSRHEDRLPPVRPPDAASFSKQPSTSAAEHGSRTNDSADQSQSPPPHERQKVGLFEQPNSGRFKGGLFVGLDTNGWKPRSISDRDEERQLYGDAGPSKPTGEELFCWRPSPSNSQQEGFRPSDASKTPSKPRLYGNICSDEWKPTFGSAGYPNIQERRESKVAFEKKICRTKDDVVTKEPVQENMHTEQEAPLQPKSCISAEDWRRLMKNE
ncbi:hypothetical protein DL765_007115 [Monosporascus sp. GIB2]|nr:hypothetical protein DL765_007115 [Monosporascus sp. GIB2]